MIRVGVIGGYCQLLEALRESYRREQMLHLPPKLRKKLVSDILDSWAKKNGGRR